MSSPKIMPHLNFKVIVHDKSSAQRDVLAALHFYLCHNVHDIACAN